MKVRLISKFFQEIHRIKNDIDDLLTVSLSTQSVLELPYQGLRLPLCYQSWDNNYGPELCSSLGLGSVKQLLPHLNLCLTLLILVNSYLTLCPPKYLKNCGGCSSFYVFDYFFYRNFTNALSVQIFSYKYVHLDSNGAVPSYLGNLYSR